MICASILISSLFGLGLILQGATGVKSCDNPTLRQSKKHISRAKKCFVFFAVIYVIKVFVDIGLVADVGDSLEAQMHKVPKLVDEHNKRSNDPHIVLLYKNGTKLFNEKEQALANSLQNQDFPCPKELKGLPDRSKARTRNMHWKGPPRGKNHRGPHKKGSYLKYHIGDIIHFDSRTNILTIKIDKIQGHIRKIAITLYLCAVAVQVLLFVAICGCIMCCNSRYKRSCDEVVMQVNNQNPVQNDSNLSESQIELVTYSS